MLIGLLALVPALVRPGVPRVSALAVSSVGAAWLAFGAQPWELLPFRDERVLAPMLRDAGTGIVDFYGVFLPFVPIRNPEMHSLVLCAVFGFTLATALLVARRHPLAASAVTVAGVGWPATIGGGDAVAFGTLALAAALAIPLILRASSLRTLGVGAAIVGLVVVGAGAASSATALGRSAAFDWESWDLGGSAHKASAVRFVWDSNYDGISFPPVKTVVLKIDGPPEPHYWRTTTLDRFTGANWSEDLFWLQQVDPDTHELQLAELTPERAANPRNWLEQRVRVEALVDDHLAAAGTPVGLDAHRIGTVFLLSDGVLRVRNPVANGETYTIWSFAPDPSPRSLANAPIRHPAVLARFLEVDGRVFPAFDMPRRDRAMRAFLRDPSYAGYAWHESMYDVARRVAGRAKTPYDAVLALESWFRQTGGFRYDESPPKVGGPPLLTFVTRTKAGYCQHFAGAMALMLRMLGVPARVAVGFTSGTRDGDTWVVTDHEAHAWVEVWFAGLGWIPFDPTPGRGNLGGGYSFASKSKAAVAALRRGDRRDFAPARSRPPDVSDLGSTTSSPSDRGPWLIGVALILAAVWILLVGIGKAVLRRLAYMTRDPRRVASASRRELEGYLRDQGAALPPNGGLTALQEAVHGELGLDGRAFTAAVARARYGPPATAEQGARASREELRRLLRAARDGLSVRARLRGFVSVRSLRATGIE